MKQRIRMLVLLSVFMLLLSDASYAVKVVIDPGHGGRDPGAIGVNGLREKDVNFRVAEELNYALRKLGYETVMTRPDDRYVSLADRVSYTNQQNADLFVSIHANAHRSSSVQGSLVLYYDNAYPQASYPASPEMKRLTPQSKRLAQNVLDHMVQEAGTKNLGIVPSSVYVVRMGTIPSILVETAFLSNPQDAAKLADRQFQRKLGEGIAKGIQAYMPAYFKDIGGHWAAQSIIKLKQQEVIEGYKNGQYKPENALTRAQFITLMDRVFGFPDPDSITEQTNVPEQTETQSEATSKPSVSLSSVQSNSTNQQTAESNADQNHHNNVTTDIYENHRDIENDIPQNEQSEETQTDEEENPDQSVPEQEQPESPPRLTAADFADMTNQNHWAYSTLDKAVQLGYLTGYPNQTLQPDRPITRAEVSLLFTKIWEDHFPGTFTGIQITPTQMTVFEDVPKDEWFAESVYQLRNKQIINGVTPNTFRPNAYMTRAQAAVMIDRYLSLATAY